MATSPSDSSNRNVLAWLDRLQTSVQAAGSKGGPGAFSLDGRFPLNGHTGGRDDDDSDQEEHNNAHRLTHAQRYGLAPVDEGNGDEMEGGGERDKNSVGAGEEDALQSSLPDSHVPLGLIANLSLSNNKKVRTLRKNREEGKDLAAEALDEDNLDDDNVVSIHPYTVSFTLSDFA